MLNGKNASLRNLQDTDGGENKVWELNENMEKAMAVLTKINEKIEDAKQEMLAVEV